MYLWSFVLVAHTRMGCIITLCELKLCCSFSLDAFVHRSEAIILCECTHIQIQSKQSNTHAHRCMRMQCAFDAFVWMRDEFLPAVVYTSKTWFVTWIWKVPVCGFKRDTFFFLSLFPSCSRSVAFSIIPNVCVHFVQLAVWVYVRMSHWTTINRFAGDGIRRVEKERRASHYRQQS